jgi:pyruvate-formate lyase-activating enzyme
MSEINDDIRGDGVIGTDHALKSVYMDDSDVMRAKLDTVSPSMCLAKWAQVSIHLTNGHTQSCYHPPIHKVPLDEIAANPSALHNTAFKKSMRKKMLDGERPSECRYCWNVEDLGPHHHSDRHYRSGEPWAASRFDEIVSQPWDADTKPSYVEVNFNQACNLKCSYCSPHLSSSWQAEIEAHGPYPTLTPHNSVEALREKGLMPIPNREHNPYVEAFWKWWPELYPSLKHFRLTGGEPLMDRNTFKVMDWVIANPKPDLNLSITSNLSVEPQLWEKFMQRYRVIDDNAMVDHFMLFISLDHWGDKAEYIRHGLDFERLLRNAEEFLASAKHGSVSFIVTYNLFSVAGFRDFLAGILELRRKYSVTRQMVWFDTPMLNFPAWQSIQTLPKDFCRYVEQDIAFMKRHVETRDTRLKGFKDYEIAKLERVLEWMRQDVDPEELRRARINFYRYFAEHDERRGTDMLSVFPELDDFWMTCHDLNVEHDDAQT